MSRFWKVSEVARMAHVTVRTLHHYDEIGLLVPSGRTDAGYRLYSENDLAILHRILLYRELGLPLDDIRRVLDEAPERLAEVLRRQRELLVAQRTRVDAIIRAVDRQLESIERGGTMTSEEMFEGFDEFENAEYAEEAKERWGDTDAYRESMRRTTRYGKVEWERIRAEVERLEAGMAELLVSGKGPEGPEAVALAEGLRTHIGRWFYPCDHAMHVRLAEMYEADPRFTAHYDRRAPGLAGFVAAAIRANAERADLEVAT